MSAPALSPALRSALSAATDDVIVFDLGGIGAGYANLRRELPGIEIRFALKACPVDEVIAYLAGLGAGADGASPAELEQARRVGIKPEAMHYGNTVKSDRDIAAAYRLGVRLFATDSLEDVAAIAEHAPGAAVFCRLSTTGEGALWGLSDKFGCSPTDAVNILRRARDSGLVPSGLSVHVGSQQMTADAWRSAFDTVDGTLAALRRQGIELNHVNLGGGLPAAGYLDRYGVALEPPIDRIFAAIRAGMSRLRSRYGEHLRFVMEPGRHLVADHGAIRAEVVRMTERRGPDGDLRRWLYLSCGRFNGLYELDALQYRLHFPGHQDEDDVAAVVAGPTCDSDDASHSATRVPRELSSGDPVWVLSSGAYALSYMTQGFNGFTPLRRAVTNARPVAAEPVPGPTTVAPRTAGPVPVAGCAR